MADEAIQTNGSVAAGPQLSLQKVYLKDASFEVPAAPHIFQEQGQPQIQLNLAQQVSALADSVYEVVLTVTVTCKLADKTAYLRRSAAGRRVRRGRFRRPEPRSRARHVLPERAVPLCPSGHFRFDPERRFPSVPDAADQLRAALRRTGSPPRRRHAAERLKRSYAARFVRAARGCIRPGRRRCCPIRNRAQTRRAVGCANAASTHTASLIAISTGNGCR